MASPSRDDPDYEEWCEEKAVGETPTQDRNPDYYCIECNAYGGGLFGYCSECLVPLCDDCMNCGMCYECWSEDYE